VTDDDITLKQLNINDLKRLRHETFQVGPDNERRENTEEGKRRPIPRPPEAGGAAPPAQPGPAGADDSAKKGGS
jgi:hypothetical protein